MLIDEDQNPSLEEDVLPDELDFGNMNTTVYSMELSNLSITNIIQRVDEDFIRGTV